MNCDDDKTGAWEARLKSLRPAPVPPGLMARLRAACPQPAAQPRCGARFPLAWAAAAAAAVLLVCVLMPSRPVPQRQTGAAPVPAGEGTSADLTAAPSQGYIVGARSAGVWRAPDGRAYRVIQCLAVNQTVVGRSDQGAQVELLEPRQRVLLLAMKSQ